jgi:hypothetical protein
MASEKPVDGSLMETTLNSRSSTDNLDSPKLEQSNINESQALRRTKKSPLTATDPLTGGKYAAALLT